MSYFDQYGLLNPYPNETSENGILFLYEYLLASNTVESSNIEHIIETMDKGDGTYIQSPFQPNDPASHDNMTAILSYYYKNRLTDKLKQVKVWGRYWHPRDLVFYSYLKGYKLAKFFMWILTFTEILTCLRTHKYRWRGGKLLTFKATDGKLLYYVRSRSVNMPLTKKICDGILKRKFGEKCWKTIFGIYFQDSKHPINLLFVN